jgi:hypothetical protein
MAKSLNDVLKLHSDALAGKRSSTTTALTTGENPGVDYADKMKDTRDFIAQHSVEKFDDRVGNGDDVYQATNVKKAKMERHGHEPKPKDIKVYNKTQQVSEEKEDMSGKPCKKCKKGKYVETSQHDDMKGVLHCSKCGSGTKRWTLKEAKDEREYGYEGDMAITQLKTICRHAEHLMKMMKPDTDLPEWVQSKITKAEDYISTAHDYLMSEMNEEVLDEGGSQYRSAAGSGKNTNPNLSKLARKLAFEKPKSYRPPGTPSKAESKAFLDAEVDKFMKKGGKIRKEEVEQLDEFKLTDEHKKAAIAKVRNRYVGGNPQFSFQKNEGGSHDLKVVAAGKEHFHRITHSKKTGLNVEKSPYMQSDEEYISEAKCNMTEAGKMCEVHGMKDCKKSSGKKLLLDKDIKEKTMSAAEKKKEESLKDKYDDSDMKVKMKKQYGDKKGEQVYFAYIRKQAMQESISDQRSSKKTSTEEARKEIYKAFLRKKERKEKMKEATTDTTNNYTVDGSNNLGFKL